MLARHFLTLVILFSKPGLLRKGARGNVGGVGSFMYWGPVLLRFPEGFLDGGGCGCGFGWISGWGWGKRKKSRWMWVKNGDGGWSRRFLFYFSIPPCDQYNTGSVGVSVHTVWPPSAVVSVCLCVCQHVCLIFCVAAAAAVRRPLLMIMTLWW